jgi:hypothetical protein
MMAAGSTYLYLGCAALLLAVALLRLPAIMRAAFIAVVLLAVVSGGPNRSLESIEIEIVAAAD